MIALYLRWAYPVALVALVVGLLVAAVTGR